MINGVKIGELRDWLAKQGADIRQPTNEWEVLRYKFEGAVRIVYKNKKGHFTYDEKTAAYAKRCNRAPIVQSPPKVAPAPAIATAKPEFQPSAGWSVRNIVRRGRGLRSLLLAATSGPSMFVSCGCQVLPWESCEHSAAVAA